MSERAFSKGDGTDDTIKAINAATRSEDLVLPLLSKIPQEQLPKFCAWLFLSEKYIEKPTGNLFVEAYDLREVFNDWKNQAMPESSDPLIKKSIGGLTLLDLHNVAVGEAIKFSKYQENSYNLAMVDLWNKVADIAMVASGGAYASSPL